MILSTYIVMEVSSEVGMIVSNNRAGTSTVRFNTEGNRERSTKVRLSYFRDCRAESGMYRRQAIDTVEDSFDPQDKRSTYLCSQVPGQPGEIALASLSVVGALVG